MADLGSKGVFLATGIVSRATPSTNARSAADIAYLQTDVTGSISGTVKIGTVAQVNVRMGLFHRSNMNLLALAQTDAFGAYSFTGLDKLDLKSYFVVALDPNPDTPYNYSLVRDHLTAG